MKLHITYTDNLILGTGNEATHTYTDTLLLGTGNEAVC